jgi:Arc/MetJ-type ribon-helix-helix transcriptional regulator
MQLLSIQIPEAYLIGIDVLVMSGYFPNRSEAIRSAVKDLMIREFGSLKGIQNAQIMLQTMKPRQAGNEEIDEL